MVSERPIAARWNGYGAASHLQDSVQVGVEKGAPASAGGRDGLTGSALRQSLRGGLEGDPEEANEAGDEERAVETLGRRGGAHHRRIGDLTERVGQCL